LSDSFKQLPYLQDLCISIVYSHLHNVYAPLLKLEPSPLAFCQANASELARGNCVEIPKEYPARVGEDSTSLPAQEQR